MIPKKFDYRAPSSIGEAIELLGENEESKVLAGGQSLLPMMKLRLASPSMIVDISSLPGLSYIEDKGDHLAIGALTPHDTLENDGLIRERFPLVSDAVAGIGDQQVRNLGTIGGSACHADPAGDLPTALLVADAQFVVEGRKGRRVVNVRDFFLDLFTTAVGRDEILVEVRLPYLPRKSSSAYMKHAVKREGFAIAMVGVALTFDDESKCAQARIGVGAAGPTPLRAPSAERYLMGKAVDEDVMAEAAATVAQEADPPQDIHGSREYRLGVIRALTKSSLRLALDRAGMRGAE
jgi:aerobic carbon-monoxide dehydrogenase medium subunit